MAAFRIILFMQKSKERVEMEIAKEEERKIFNAEQIIKDKATVKKSDQIQYIKEGSLARIIDEASCRQSYRGRNPYIETLNYNEELSDPNRGKMQGVTDEEMAERYSTLVGTIGKKFTPKRSRSDNGRQDGKKTFKRPREDDDDDS